LNLFVSVFNSTGYKRLIPALWGSVTAADLLFYHRKDANLLVLNARRSEQMAHILKF